MDCNFKIERIADFSDLDNFECGVAQMDNFIHGNLKFCDVNHYCSTFVVKDITNEAIAALFSLSFDSVNLDIDDFEDLHIGAAETDDLAVDDTFRSTFEKKYSYPALEISYFAIDKHYMGQGLGREIIDVIVERAKTQDVAACLFLTVNALHTKEYSAVGFYEKCRFAKLSPVPQMDVWPMYKTIWVK
ncbi:GNAT family N-acetyltransferase [Parabacteroides distasonis]|nr:GNAT family N-acetyltransferase [Parabacteroides distasonis]